jgi:hypothetical protein
MKKEKHINLKENAGVNMMALLFRVSKNVVTFIFFLIILHYSSELFGNKSYILKNTDKLTYRKLSVGEIVKPYKLIKAEKNSTALLLLRNKGKPGKFEININGYKLTAPIYLLEAEDEYWVVCYYSSDRECYVEVLAIEGDVYVSEQDVEFEVRESKNPIDEIDLDIGMLIRKIVDVQERYKVVILRIFKDGIAEKSGLREGDILLGFDDKDICAIRKEIKSTLEKNGEIKLKIIREDKEVIILLKNKW